MNARSFLYPVIVWRRIPTELTDEGSLTQSCISHL